MTSSHAPPAPIPAAELFREHARFVAGFAAKMGATRTEVDDIVQEVFLVVHRKGGFVPDRAKPTTYLADIAVRVLSTLRRSQRRQRIGASDDVLTQAPTEAESPYDTTANREAIGRVQRILSKLPEEQRAVFILFELEEQSCDEIAAGLDVPVGTVYSRLHAARKAFQKAYARKSAPSSPGGAIGMAGGAP